MEEKIERIIRYAKAMWPSSDPDTVFAVEISFGPSAPEIISRRVTLVRSRRTENASGRIARSTRRLYCDGRSACEALEKLEAVVAHELENMERRIRVATGRRE